MKASCPKNSRWTVPRKAIMDVFCNTKSHLSAEDVYMILKKSHPDIGIATIYRNLEFLTRHGFLRQFNFTHGKSYYEIIDEDNDHHHHLICNSCGKIIDYSEFIQRETRLIKDLEKELSRKHNFTIDTHQLHFYGLCQKCNKK